jgi:hypothetical protein
MSGALVTNIGANSNLSVRSRNSLTPISTLAVGAAAVAVPTTAAVSLLTATAGNPSVTLANGYSAQHLTIVKTGAFAVTVKPATGTDVVFTNTTPASASLVYVNAAIGWLTLSSKL